MADFYNAFTQLSMFFYQENLFSELKGPVARIGAQPIPPPHSPPLVNAMIPEVDQIVSAALRLIGR